MTDDTSGVVTTVVTRRVKPGRFEDYERSLRELLAAVEQFDGYLGADIHPPATTGDAVYTSVFRFASLEQRNRFQAGEINRTFLETVDPFVDSDPVWATHTGLEMWFSPPPGTIVAQPVRWRMAVLLGSVVYVLVLVLGRIATALIGAWPTPVRLAIVIAIEIALMTYLILPRLTRSLARWIYPRTVTTAESPS
jgi:antibiotic biosynthesis monooxygenase (ABM) superfamily enzyme